VSDRVLQEGDAQGDRPATVFAVEAEWGHALQRPGAFDGFRRGVQHGGAHEVRSHEQRRLAGGIGAEHGRRGDHAAAARVQTRRVTYDLGQVARRRGPQVQRLLVSDGSVVFRRKFEEHLSLSGCSTAFLQNFCKNANGWQRRASRAQ
jgi:hypothetical protein